MLNRAFGTSGTCRIAVLGGGISGLAAAYQLARARRAGAPVQEFLIDAAPRLGGLIHTEEVNGFLVEAGPDSFLAEKPEAAALCRELGLGESLIGSNDHQRRTYILHRGASGRKRLVPLPAGLTLFVPTRFCRVMATPLLPVSSKLAIVGDWFRRAPAPPRPALHDSSPETGADLASGTDENGLSGGGANAPAADESAASFVARHFGRAMVENIAGPLLAGVFGGDASRLSAQAVLPRFWEMERKHGSLTRAAARLRKQVYNGAGIRPPLFLTLDRGLGILVRAIADQLDSVHLCKRAVSIQRNQQHDTRPSGSISSYTVQSEDAAYEADAVILALPAYECSRILSALDGPLSRALAGISYTSALTVALGYGTGVSERLPPGFGFLVPRQQQSRLLACTFVHSKFTGRVPAGHALLRCFLGGSRDPGVLALDDDEIFRLVRREVGEILGLTVEPEFFRAFRWPSAMPQYEVGHAARLSAIKERLEHHPGLFLAGNAYSGIGISDCIRTGFAAAQRALQMVSPDQTAKVS